MLSAGPAPIPRRRGATTVVIMLSARAGRGRAGVVEGLEAGGHDERTTPYRDQAVLGAGGSLGAGGWADCSAPRDEAEGPEWSDNAAGLLEKESRGGGAGGGRRGGAAGQTKGRVPRGFLALAKREPEAHALKEVLLRLRGGAMITGGASV